MSKLKFIAHRRGYTLIELLMFVAMFSVIITILMEIYSAIVSKQVEVEQFSSVDSDRIYLQARLGYDISRASSITTPSVVGATSPSLVIVIDGSNYTYALSQNKIRLTTGGNTDDLSSFRSSISSLIFERVGNTNGANAVRVRYSIQSTLVDQTPESHSIDTTFTTYKK